MALDFNMPSDAEAWAAPCLRDWFGEYSEYTGPGEDGEFWQWVARGDKLAACPDDPAQRPWKIAIVCFSVDPVFYRCEATASFNDAEFRCEFMRLSMEDAISAALGVMAEFLRLNTPGQENVRAPHAPPKVQREEHEPQWKQQIRADLECSASGRDRDKMR